MEGNKRSTIIAQTFGILYEHGAERFAFSGGIQTKSGLLIATGITRVVHGGRGSYIEFTNEQVVKTNLFIPDNAKWRMNGDYSYLVYYVEYRTKDECNVKVYFQKKLVGYADYKIGRWYVSLNDVEVSTRETGQQNNA